MKKLFKTLILVAIIVVYTAIVLRSIIRLPMNSDSAGMLLYADDILSGNIFLSGWHLTGLTFLTTDLPFFIIGVAIFGVGINAFRTAVALMYFFMLICSIPLVVKTKNRWLGIAFFAAMGLFPTNYALSNTFVHTACFALVFLSAHLCNKYNETDQKKYIVFFALTTALATAGDHMAFALIVFPVLLLCLLKKFKKPVFVAGSTIVGCVSGVVIEYLYLFIGKAELNSITRTTFTDITSVPKNIQVYSEYFLKLINASFFEKNIFSIKTAVFALKILIAIFAVIIIIRCFKKLFSSESVDIPTAVLGTGFLLVSVILWLTSMSIDITAGRYIAYLPLLLGVTLARADIDYKTETRVMLFIVCIILTASSLMPRGSEFSPYNRYSELAEYLENENLTRGYSSFWDSFVINAYSENKVKINPVRNTENGIAPRLWFSKLSEYKEKTTFFLFRNNGCPEDEKLYNYNGIYNVFLDSGKGHGKTFEIPLTYESVIKTFGKPSEVKKFKNYSILVYEDLSKKLAY